MWLTGLMIGLAGSLHCLGMCSPLVMAVTGLRKQFILNRLVYNGGRIVTYGIQGALISAFGSLFRLGGLQNILTVLLGVTLVIMGLAGTSHLRIPFIGKSFQRLVAAFKNLFGKILREKTTFSVAMLGMLNGLLPCGLTYLALTYCLTLSSPGSGFLFMLIFGVGTLPIMLGFTSVLQGQLARFSFSIRNFTTVAMIALGAMLIVRSTWGHQSDVHLQPKESIVICK